MRKKPLAEHAPRHVLDSVEYLDRLAASMAADDGPRVLLQTAIPDKYSCAPAPAIDCEARIPICRAACCRLNVVLSQQDIEEGIVSWDPRRPYLNTQDSAGYCAHLERPSCRCSIYASRPAPCRIYDCRHDGRIWIDFESRIPNPALEQLAGPPQAGSHQAPNHSSDAPKDHSKPIARAQSETPHQEEPR